MSFENPDESLTLQQVYDEIMARSPEHSPQPSLERMEYVLDLLGHPESSFKVIHVTGTNGKGSTSRMAEALVRAYGLRTGLYTSPHLESVTERIAIDGKPISDEQFVDIYKQVKDFIELTDRHSLAVGGERMSFFEVLTTMAIWAFADAPVDVAVMEVGMGGRWDATNVLNADAAIIGPVDLDHMQWLGSTVEQIATEKAGIIKPGSTVIMGPQPHEEAARVIEETARATEGVRLLRDGEELKVLARVPAVGGQMASLLTAAGEYRDVPIKAFGEHQAHNALAALAAAETVIPVSGVLNPDLVEEALSSVSLPGRMETVRHSPFIMIDGAHNPHAMTAVRKAIEENFDFKYLVGVVSMMADKQVEEVLGILEPLLANIVITQNSNVERVMPAEDLAKIARSVFGEDRVIVEPLLPNAIQRAVNLVDAADETGVGYGYGVLVTGSFVTAGDARRLLKEHSAADVQREREAAKADADAENAGMTADADAKTRADSGVEAIGKGADDADEDAFDPNFDPLTEIYGRIFADDADSIESIQADIAAFQNGQFGPAFERLQDQEKAAEQGRAEQTAAGGASPDTVPGGNSAADADVNADADADDLGSRPAQIR